MHDGIYLMMCWQMEMILRIMKSMQERWQQRFLKAEDLNHSLFSSYAARDIFANVVIYFIRGQKEDPNQT